MREEPEEPDNSSTDHSSGHRPITSIRAPAPAQGAETTDVPLSAPRVSQAWLQALAFAVIYLVWGSTYLGVRVAVETLPPFLMAACRFLVAGSLLYAIMRLKGVAVPHSGEWKRASLAGLLMLTTGSGLVAWAEQQMPSNMAALMIAAVPLFTALLDWLRPGGARPQRRVFAGIGIGAAGMALLVSSRAPEGEGGASTIGVLALLLSGLAWAVGSLYSRYGGMNDSPLMAAAQQMIAGGVGLLLIAISRGEPGTLSAQAFTVRGVGAFLYLTLFGSLLAFSAFGWLVKVTTPACLSTTAYVNPVVAVFLGWLLLGETLTPGALGGAALIVCAVIAMTAQTPKIWARTRILLGQAKPAA